MLKGSFFGMYLLSLGVILKKQKIDAVDKVFSLLPILGYFFHVFTPPSLFINKLIQTSVSVTAVNIY